MIHQLALCLMLVHANMSASAAPTTEPDAMLGDEYRLNVTIESQYPPPKLWAGTVAPNRLKDLTMLQEPVDPAAGERRRQEYLRIAAIRDAFVQRLLQEAAKLDAPISLVNISKELTASQDNRADLFVSPDGNRAVYLRDRLDPCLLQPATRQVATLPLGPAYTSSVATWSSDSRLVAMTLNTKKDISVYDTTDAKEVSRIIAKDYAESLIFSPQADILFAVTSTRRLGSVFRAAASHPLFMDTFFVQRIDLKTGECQRVLVVRDVPEIDVRCRLSIHSP